MELLSPCATELFSEMASSRVCPRRTNQTTAEKHTTLLYYNSETLPCFRAQLMDSLEYKGGLQGLPLAQQQGRKGEGSDRRSCGQCQKSLTLTLNLALRWHWQGRRCQCRCLCLATGK